jgi:hypothetical protein
VCVCVCVCVYVCMHVCRCVGLKRLSYYSMILTSCRSAMLTRNELSSGDVVESCEI